MAEICMFAANYLPNIGGIERYTLYVGRQLTAMGHHVTIVTNNCFGLADKEEADGMMIYRLPCYNFLRGRYPCPQKNKTYRRLYREIEQLPFDFVVIHARFYFHSLNAAKMAYRRRIPCITIEHGTGHLSVNQPLLDKAGALFEHFLTAQLKRYCHHYYGVSQAACDWSAHFGIRSEGVLYNAVDIEEIETLAANRSRSFKEEFGVPDGLPVVAFVGRLIPEKGIVQLIDAIEQLKQPVRLLVAGDGALAEQLNKRERQKTILLGPLPFNEVIALLSESDIFCLPSDSEGMPTSVLEAVAAGCFVITTAHGGAKELIVDENHGIIMEDNRLETVKNALTRALSDPAYCQRAAEVCKEALCRHFTFTATAGRIVEVMEELRS